MTSDLPYYVYTEGMSFESLKIFVLIKNYEVSIYNTSFIIYVLLYILQVVNTSKVRIFSFIKYYVFNLVHRSLLVKVKFKLWNHTTW